MLTTLELKLTVSSLEDGSTMSRLSCRPRRKVFSDSVFLVKEVNLDFLPVAGMKFDAEPHQNEDHVDTELGWTVREVAYNINNQRLIVLLDNDNGGPYSEQELHDIVETYTPLGWKLDR